MQEETTIGDKIVNFFILTTKTCLVLAVLATGVYVGDFASKDKEGFIENQSNKSSAMTDGAMARLSDTVGTTENETSSEVLIYQFSGHWKNIRNDQPSEYDYSPRVMYFTKPEKFSRATVMLTTSDQASFWEWGLESVRGVQYWLRIEKDKVVWLTGNYDSERRILSEFSYQGGGVSLQLDHSRGTVSISPFSGAVFSREPQTPAEVSLIQSDRILARTNVYKKELTTCEIMSEVKSKASRLDCLPNTNR